jgi:hypothetical protein
MNYFTQVNACYNLNCKFNDGSQSCLKGNGQETIALDCNGTCMDFEVDEEYIQRQKIVDT